MLWLAVTGPGTTSVSPIDAATSSILGYVLSFGPLGLIVVVFGWLLWKGYRLVSPEREAAIRAQGRSDLVAERDRLIDEKHNAELQRDEALKVASDLAPLLSTFIASTGALIPILQGIIADGRRRGGHS